MRLATDDDMDGWFDVDERTDYAQAAIDEWSRGQKERPPGVFPVVVNTLPPGQSPRRKR